MKTLIIIVMLSTSIAMSANADESALKTLVSDYYKAVAGEDIAGVSALMVFENEKAKEAILLQYKATFAVMDMTFASVEVTGIEITADKSWATIFVTLDSTVTFSDGSEADPIEALSCVILARRGADGWQLAKVMRASTYLIVRNATTRRKAWASLEAEKASKKAAPAAADEK